MKNFNLACEFFMNLNFNSIKTTCESAVVKRRQLSGLRSGDDIIIGREVWGSILRPVKSEHSVANGSPMPQRFLRAAFPWR